MNAPDRPPVSPLDAIPDMRATAKWILAAAAAVGAALLGVGPLAAMGQIQHARAAILAFVGLVTGLAGVGWAIWCTAEALIPPLTTPRSLDTDPRLRELRGHLAADPAAFYGPFGTSMAELQAALALHTRVAANLTASLEHEHDDHRRQVLTNKLTEARTAVDAIGRRIRGLLELCHAWLVRAQLRRARAQTFAGAALAALGVVVFLFATSTSPTPAKPRTNPSAVPSAVPAAS